MGKAPAACPVCGVNHTPNCTSPKKDPPKPGPCPKCGNLHYPPCK